MREIAIGKVAAFPDPGRRIVEVDGVAVGVFCRDGTFTAYENVCPHMALAQDPKLLLLDEPFAGLSVDERRDVQKLLLAIPRDVTVVMIEHNMDVALELADRITLLHFGEVIVEGTRAAVVADPRTREVYLGV